MEFPSGGGVLTRKQTRWQGSGVRGIDPGRKIELGAYSERFLGEAGILDCEKGAWLICDLCSMTGGHRDPG